MGGDAMFRAICRTQATGAAFNVLMALCSWADQEGWCRPSMAQIAKRSKVLRKNVPRALADLRELGEVEVFPRGHNQRDPIREKRIPRGGWQPTNLYRVVFVDELKRVDGPSRGVLSARTPSAAKGVLTPTPKGVLKSADLTSLVQVSTTSQAPAARSTPSAEPETDVTKKWRATLTKKAHELLGKGFEGEPLREQLERWAGGPRVATSDDLQVAIETAIENRRASAHAAHPPNKEKTA